MKNCSLSFNFHLSNVFYSWVKNIPCFTIMKPQDSQKFLTLLDNLGSETGVADSVLEPSAPSTSMYFPSHSMTGFCWGLKLLSEITLALLSNAESEIKIQMKTTTNSKWMKMKAVFFPFSQKCNLAAAWLSKELRRHNSQVLVNWMETILMLKKNVWQECLGRGKESILNSLKVLVKFQDLLCASQHGRCCHGSRRWGPQSLCQHR